MAAVAGRVSGAYLVDVARAYVQVGDLRGRHGPWWTRTVSRRLRFGVGLWRVP
ncbi:hypothetical protein NKG94_07345 [Micromonospora sp. M12]